MKRVLTAVILIPSVVLALFRAPLWLFALLVLGVALLAAREYFDIAEKTGYRPMRVLGYIATGYIFLISAGLTTSFDLSGFFLMALFISTLPVALIAFVMLSAHMRRQSPATGLPDVGISLLSLAYVAAPLSVLVVVRSVYGLGSLFLLFLMLIVWAGDITAFYVGRSLGRHKLAPRISPGKTWEGALGSVVASVIVGVLLFHFGAHIETAFARIHLLAPGNYPLVLDPQRSGTVIVPFKGAMWLVVLFALCVNVAAQIGDLVESSLKRGAGLKDSGSLLPGHGGVLDRIDALLFALPVGFVFCALGLWWMLMPI